MLSRNMRLTKNRDVQRVLQKGIRTSADGLRVAYLRNSNQRPRFTVVVSAKTSKLATVRNRAKRQIRAVLRQFVYEHPNYSIDAVIVINQINPRVDLALAIDQILQKLKT